MRIAIIGAGNMGGAIARGVAAHTGDKIIVSNPSRGKLDALVAEFPIIETSLDNGEACRNADMVILAVKPWKMQGVIDEISDVLDPKHQTIVSIAGGVSLDDLDQMLGSKAIGAIFHVIPDTAISIGRGMTFISSRRALEQQIRAVSTLFGCMGQVAVIEERLMGAATALSSCGIAYAYKYIQACVQAGVQMGFYPADALRYTIATVDGAVSLLRSNGSLPQQEIDKVTTPGGMTIKGINSLERNGFSAAVIDAILAPLQK